MSSKFLYVTYIRTTPEKLWDALTKPEFTRAYWFGITLESEWKKAASWKMMIPDGRVGDSGEIIEIERPKKLVLSWRNEFRSEMREEGYSRCTFTLEPEGDTVKLTILHQIDRDGSKLIEAVSGGWPKILASLKSMLETGKPLDEIHTWARVG